MAGRLLACALFSATPVVPAQQGVLAPDEDPVDVYLRAIEEAQTTGGPYASELVDLYYGFGKSLLEEGDLEAARDAFHRTVMVARVNSGPNSLEQSNYLYSVAQIESLLGNFEEAVGVLEHIYLLHARRYGENDPAMLPVVEEINAWYTEQKPLGAPFVRSADLLNRSFLAKRIATLSEARYGLGDARTAAGYRALGQISFRAILHMIQTGEPPQPELVMSIDISGSHLAFERAIGSHFESGEEAFERAVEAWRQNPESTALEVAEATAQLGDWYLALKHFRAAEKQYERAYRLLSDSDEVGFLADQYLGKPAPLRFLNSKDPFLRDLNPPVPENGLEISMTVTRNGRLYDIEVVSAPESEPAEELQNLKERLENTRFRPAVVDGEVQKMEGFVWKPVFQSRKVAARNR